MHTTSLISQKTLKRRHSGFSLMEILIVIALIAAVTGLLITNLDTIFGSNKEKVADIFVNESVKAPLMAYRINMGNYPNSDEGLGALSAAPSGKEKRWKGPYIDKLPEDPWGNSYHYRFPGTHNTNGYDIWSDGPDGSSGTEDDIGNW